MSRYVVDASVAVKWYLPEVHDLSARRLLTGTEDLLVPDLIFSEVGNILWKRVRSQQMSEAEAQTVLQSLGTLPLVVSPSWPLALSALMIACQAQRTVYDNLYLALAVRENAIMVTADEKFYNALQATPLAPSVLWVEDIP
jgi:predicted nucleic acid-binding protein